jgi:integrase/recombinase XerD
MSNAGIGLRIIQEISGHNNLEQLQRYLEVKPDRVKGAIASLSMLSYTGKGNYPHLGPITTTATSANSNIPIYDL